jgi:SAM-dependent methyltransferase
MKFPESRHAHQLLDGLSGLEIGGSAHNAFGLDTKNVDYTDDMTTVFKLSEVERCGEAMPVDIVADGCGIPVADKSFDFVISSHVIEHFFDPIAALKEWSRVARHYIYIICPQRDALPSDRDLPLTGLDELEARHTGAIEAPEIDMHGHYSRWTPASFCEMCRYFGFEVLDVLEYDDKVGNGFTVVLKPLEI